MEERRGKNRRKALIRNLFSYLNRRNLFRKGRRHNEQDYNDMRDPLGNEKPPED